jgi:tRNA dimethylallyltransferase
MSKKESKLIVVLGPTASGKSELAVKLAKKFKGEVISADSRQVYKGIDIGTGKITKREMEGVPHYLLDVVSFKKRFTVIQYRKLALRAMEKISNKGKIPILCGGTGFYIQAVVDGIMIPRVPPDWKLRRGLEKKSADRLYQLLKKIDPRRARTIDRKNPRRLIRAIEIVLKIKKPVPKLKKHPLPYPVLMLGIKKSDWELKKLIKNRFLKWLKTGLIAEIKTMKKSGLSWQRIEDFGLHYKIISRYLQDKLNRQEMIENSLKELEHYAQRQMTWFRRDKRICWVKNYKEAEVLAKKFLSN